MSSPSRSAEVDLPGGQDLRLYAGKHLNAVRRLKQTDLLLCLPGLPLRDAAAMAGAMVGDGDDVQPLLLGGIDHVVHAVTAIRLAGVQMHIDSHAVPCDAR